MRESFQPSTMSLPCSMLIPQVKSIIPASFGVSSIAVF
jgi:hypothetical protein